MKNIKCPICNFELEYSYLTRFSDDESSHKYDCNHCGKYTCYCDAGKTIKEIFLSLVDEDKSLVSFTFDKWGLSINTVRYTPVPITSWIRIPDKKSNDKSKSKLRKSSAFSELLKRTRLMLFL